MSYYLCNLHRTFYMWWRAVLGMLFVVSANRIEAIRQVYFSAPLPFSGNSSIHSTVWILTHSSMALPEDINSVSTGIWTG